MQKDVILTQEGLEKLKKEYEFLVNDKRPKIIQTIQSTRAMGDLSENGGYQAALEEQSFVDKRIEELQEILKNPSIINNTSSSKVSIGNTILVTDMSRKEDVTYKLVGATEANPMEGLISNESPLGKALLGASVGNLVSVETPVGKIEYKVKKIS